MLTWTVTYCFVIVMMRAASSAELDDATVKKLLEQTPEIPAIPTKNGQYIFIPSSPNNGTTSPTSGSSPASSGSSPASRDVVSGPNNKSCKNQLRGVNRSGFEYSCVKNLGISEGPMDDNAIQLMTYWKINAVRVPLSEDCWLGLHDFNPAYIGNNYRQAVVDYVTRLRKHGLKVILDLHWTDGLYSGDGQGECVDERAKCQKPMPDKKYAPEFWKSVASQFKNDDGIIFDLFNEPFPNKVIGDKTTAWKCWRDGGSACPGFNYEVAGMQDLVNAVRDAGANNLVMLGGLDWANDLSQWLEYKPTDKGNNMAAAWHSYDFNACNNEACWESQVAKVADQYPVIVGEIGEHDCNHGYIDKLMSWLDKKGINYIAWVWNTWDCASGPALISDYNGTPNNFGQGYKDHLWNVCNE